MQPTALDKANEASMVALMQSRGWHVDHIGNPYYPADFLATKDGRQVLVEYKRRFFNHDRYPTFQMFGKKFAEVKMLGQYMGLSTLLVSQWDDKVGYISLDYIQPPVVIGGRKDRGRIETEPCVNIPLDWFTFI